MDDEHALRRSLDAALSRERGRPVLVHAITRQPIVESASHTLERIDLTTDDGEAISLALKRLGPAGLSDAVQRFEPDLFKDSRREPLVYRQLDEAGIEGVPRLRAAGDGGPGGRPWLLLDWIEGTLLWRLGDLDAWAATARWAARLHARFAGLEAGDLLPDRDAAWYWTWARRAEIFAQRRSRKDRRRLGRIVERYGRVVDRLLSLPRTLIHAELFPANVIMRREHAGWSPYVVDWESAAIGCGLTDLACLTAGRWSDADRAWLVGAYDAAYREQLAAWQPDLPRHWPTVDDLTTDLLWCRLQLAVQWLGWAPTHDGPPEQANDWLGEATTLAELVGL